MSPLSALIIDRRELPFSVVEAPLSIAGDRVIQRKPSMVQFAPLRAGALA